MKPIAIFVCAAFLLAAATTGALAAPPPKGPVTYVFVGFTDDATNALRGTIDGAMVRDLRSAIKRYQTDSGIPATGDLDDATLAKLGISE